MLILYQKLVFLHSSTTQIDLNVVQLGIIIMVTVTMAQLKGLGQIFDTSWTFRPFFVKNVSFFFLLQSNFVILPYIMTPLVIINHDIYTLQLETWDRRDWTENICLDDNLGAKIHVLAVLINYHLSAQKRKNRHKASVPTVFMGIFMT